MSDQVHAIGDLSRLSGVSVRRIRFYSDKGLLPPTLRAESGYRMYSETDLARLDLIVALRDAGVSLGEIRKILSKNLPLGEVLRLRLSALEAELASKRRVAAALRAATRIPDPTHQDLRRLWTVINISQSEFRAAIERFYDQVADGARMDPEWKKQMVDAGTPQLPDDPTPEQIDAWTEVMAMITDKDYIEQVRADASSLWNDEFDPAAYAEAANTSFDKVRTAIDGGISPASAEGRAIAQDWLEGSARAMKRAPDQTFLDWQLGQYRKHHARSARYQELMAILQGDTAPTSSAQEWTWIVAAMEHHLQG